MSEPRIYDASICETIPASLAAEKMTESWLDHWQCTQTLIDWIEAYRAMAHRVRLLEGDAS